MIDDHPDECAFVRCVVPQCLRYGDVYIRFLELHFCRDHAFCMPMIFYDRGH